MNFQDLYSLVMTLAALSVASERLVEIIKGLVPYLGRKNDDTNKELLRTAAIQLIAIAAGTLTASLAHEILPSKLGGDGNFQHLLVIGIMTSGGVGFWNTILSYLVKIKDIKSAKAMAIRMVLPSTEKLAQQAILQTTNRPAGQSDITPIVTLSNGSISIDI